MAALSLLVRSVAVPALGSVLAFAALHPANAQDAGWHITKSSGEAWLTSKGVRSVSLNSDTTLQPGDAIGTGRNGRVLLARGAENILVSPNSSVSLPEEGRPGMSTIIQQAGTILLDVEKKNVQHFEVETPYLAAVVKGTRFRVSVEDGRARVDVLRGQVQVSDFKSGQYAFVMPGQSARVMPNRVPGLSLAGAGALGHVEQGQPQPGRVAPIVVPRGGLKASPASVPLPRTSVAAKERAPSARPSRASADPSMHRDVRAAGVARSPSGVFRISAPLGEVKLDIHKVTRGLAHGETAGQPAGPSKGTVWSTRELSPGTNDNKGSVGNSGSASATPSLASSAAPTSTSGSVASGGASSVASTAGATSAAGSAVGLPTLSAVGLNTAQASASGGGSVAAGKANVAPPIKGNVAPPPVVNSANNGGGNNNNDNGNNSSNGKGSNNGNGDDGNGKAKGNGKSKGR